MKSLWSLHRFGQTDLRKWKSMSHSITVTLYDWRLTLNINLNQKLQNHQSWYPESQWYWKGYSIAWVWFSLCGSSGQFDFKNKIGSWLMNHDSIKIRIPILIHISFWSRVIWYTILDSLVTSQRLNAGLFFLGDSKKSLDRTRKFILEKMGSLRNHSIYWLLTAKVDLE